MSRKDDNTLSLFGDDTPTATKPETKTPTKPVEYPKPKSFYTYDEYLKFHCGNRSAASYWFSRQVKRLGKDKE